MTDVELQALAELWQSRIRFLRSWSIKARFVGPKELRGKMWGRIDYDDAIDRAAEIKVLAPDAMRKRFGRVAVEATVVHELLHIFMEEELEKRIDITAEALITAHGGEWNSN